MEFDLKNKDNFTRLKEAVKYNYEQLRPFRTVRKLCVEAARGHYYNTNDSNPSIRRNPVNMLDQYVQVVVRSFVQSNPKARVTSRAHPRQAKIFEAHLNETIKEIDLVDTLRRCVMEAILGNVGVAYCGIYDAGEDSAGESYVSPVSFEDFVIDKTNTDIKDADLVGHRSYRRIQEMKDGKYYKKSEVDRLVSRSSTTSELRDDPETVDFDRGTLFDWAEVWAVKINPTNEMAYFAENSEEPLRVESYDGPDFGPYVYLAFDKVLDEMIPNSRGALLLDLHEFVNAQYRQIFMNENMSAEFWTYSGGSEDDARRMKNAMNGQMIRVENNQAVQRRKKGGTNPQALGTAIHATSVFDDMSGQLRAKGGVPSSADTATQAQMDNANTTQLVRDMQLQFFDFVRTILQNLAWYEWTNPMRERQVEIKIGSNGYAVQDLWSPEQRDGDFVEYEIDIVPDSMEHRSSRQQLAELMKAIQGVAIPLAQMPSPRPIVVKTPEVLQKYSELANLPELAEVVDYAIDEESVSQNQTSGSGLRIPAGATSDGRLNGGSRGGGQGPSFEQQALSSAINGQQGGPTADDG